MWYFTAALIVGLALTSTGAGDARAAEAWCAWYDPYTYDCGFTTFEQCQTAVFASSGYCRAQGPSSAVDPHDKVGAHRAT